MDKKAPNAPNTYHTKKPYANNNTNVKSGHLPTVNAWANNPVEVTVDKVEATVDKVEDTVDKVEATVDTEFVKVSRKKVIVKTFNGKGPSRTNALAAIVS
jgi:hypothetical protein